MICADIGVVARTTPVDFGGSIGVLYSALMAMPSTQSTDHFSPNDEKWDR